MSLHLFRKSGKRGFTLVELLIVVAIIGVLSTIGVPTFRRMIQKSKKSEAKVVLGGLYTTEAAFNAEYNAYGNNLPLMGYEIEGQSNPTTLTYSVGFFAPNCAALPAATQPSTGAVTAALNTAFPAYYVGAVNSRLGHNTVPAKTVCYLTALVPAPDVATDGTTFRGLASGLVSPSATVAAGPYDVWTIDNARNLSNVQDGIR